MNPTEQNILKEIEETDKKISEFMKLRGFEKDTFNHYWQIVRNDIALERISLVYAGDLFLLGYQLAQKEEIEFLKEMEDYCETKQRQSEERQKENLGDFDNGYEEAKKDMFYNIKKLIEMRLNKIQNDS